MGGAHGLCFVILFLIFFLQKAITRMVANLGPQFAGTFKYTNGPLLAESNQTMGIFLLMDSY
jgi:hypothetical protein